MFDNLSGRLREAARGLTGKGRLTESNIKDTLRQVRLALLEADDPKARQAFAALVGQYDEDPLTMFHLGRLLAGETGAEIELTEK